MSLSIERAVGQMLMVAVQGESGGETAKALIEEIGVGGVIGYPWSNGFESPEVVSKWTYGFQRQAIDSGSLPLFVGVDGEGGRVWRFDESVTHFPSPGDLGKINDSDLLYRIYKTMTVELRAMGFNCNLAPCADVAEEGSYIGDRSFGDDPQRVSALSHAAARGLEDGGMAACLKHFPGHGRARDSHLGPAEVSGTLDQLEERDLIPFIECAPSTSIVMPGHIRCPEIDSSAATISSYWVQEVLRERYGFEGIVMTDSLSMKGLLGEDATRADVAVASVKAGVDVLLLGGRSLFAGKPHEVYVEHVAAMRDAILAAVNEGQILEERIYQSVERITTRKNRICTNLTPPYDLAAEMACAEHADLLAEVQERLV